MFALLLYLSVFLALVSTFVLILAPETGYLLLFLSKPIIDTAFYQPLLFGLPLTKIVGGVVPIIVLMQILFARGSRSIRFMPLKGIMLTYACYVFFFSLVIVFKDGITNGLEVFFRHINVFIGFYLMQALFREKDKLKMLLVVLIVSGIFPMSSVIYQHVTGFHLKYQGIMEIGELTRSAGLYFHSMTARFYAYQSLVAMLLYSAYYARKPAINIIMYIYGMIAVFVIISTFSKSGFLALVITGLVWTTLQKKFTWLIVMLLAGISLLPIYFQDIISTINTVFFLNVDTLSSTEGMLRGRLPLWENMLNEWHQFGMLAQIFSSGHIKTNAHNDYLQMLFHGGIVGLLIYLFLLIAVGFKTIRNLFLNVSPLNTAALILYFSWLIDSIGLVPSGYPHYSWLVWGIIGLSLRQMENKKIVEHGIISAPRSGDVLRRKVIV